MTTIALPGLLRIAAALSAIQGTAHGALFILAKPKHGPVEMAVVDAMRSHSFDFAGAQRSYWDFYYGYGLEAAAVCMVEAILLWLLSGLARTNPTLTRPFVVVFILANVAHILLAARFFFFVPILFDLVIIAALVAAFVAAARGS
jgi:hypothetical protein